MKKNKFQGMKIFVCKNLRFLFYSSSLEGVIRILHKFFLACFMILMIYMKYPVWKWVNISMQIGGFQVHAQVLITSWIVIAILLSLAFFAT